MRCLRHRAYRLLWMRWPGTGWRRLKQARLVESARAPRALLHPALLLLLLLPLPLALLLPDDSLRYLADWRPAWARATSVGSTVGGGVVGAASWAFGLVMSAYEWVHSQLDEWERTEREREREARAYRARYQKGPGRPPPPPPSSQPRQRSTEWEWEQQQQQRRQRQQQQQQQQQQQRARAPARSQPSESDALRARAMRLPAGEIRTVLLSETHYAALGLPRSASGAEAKKAFHKLALRLHPDKNKQPLAEEAFKRVEEAHRTLSDAALRRDYDLTLPVAPGTGRGHNGGARRAAQPSGGYYYYHEKWD